MKVLLDEDLPHRLRTALAEFEVSTASYAGLLGLKNGMLLTAAEAAGFQILVTGDKKMSYQQNMMGRSVAVVTLFAQEWPLVAPHMEAISAAIGRAQPGTFQFVECGEFRR